jgi:outer membrane protein TolC
MDEAALERPLTLKDVELAALARHPSLVAAAHRVRALTARAGAEGSLPSPELMLEVWRIPFSRPYALDQANMIMLSVRQQFPAAGSLDFMAEATALEARAEAAKVAAEARAILREVDRAFVDYAEATMLHGAHLAHRRILEQMAGAARARYSAGAPLGDVTKAELERARLDVHVAHEHGMIEEARAKLNGLLARPVGAALGPPRIEEPQTVHLSAEEAAAQAVAKSPEVAAADLMEKSARSSVRAADREALVPSFMVGFNYFHPTAGQPVGYGVSLSMSLPWLWGAGSNRARSAEHRAAAERASAENARLRVRTGAATALASVRAAARQYLILRDVALPAARRALDVAQAAYASGGADVLAWLDAERSSLDVSIELATAQANLARALADLDWAAGEHLPRAPLTSLEEVHHER